MRICILSAYEDSMQNDTGASVRIINLAKGLAATGNVAVIILKFASGVVVQPEFEIDVRRLGSISS